MKLIYKNIYSNYLALSRMTLKQITYRIIKIIKYKFIYKYFKTDAYNFNLESDIDLNGELPFHFIYHENALEVEKNIMEDTIKKSERILSDKCLFLQKEYTIKNQLLLNKISDTLWKYNYHYFDFGVTLLKSYLYTQDKKYYDKLKYYINDWIDNTSTGSKISWDPYPTSIRIVNWLVILYGLKNTISDNTFKKKLVSSIIKQTNFLFANLEFDLDNNHLTCNSKALIWAGILLDDYKNADRWLKKGLSVLKKRFNSEFLSDGFQYEASTSYLMLAFIDYFEILILLRANNMDCDVDLQEKIKNIVFAFLSVIRPDGQMPLLNDSVKEYPINECDILTTAAAFFNISEFKIYYQSCKYEYLLWTLGKKGYSNFSQLKPKVPAFDSKPLSDVGYYVMKTGWDKKDSYLIFDCGSLGPSHCPGHGHADTLSFELYSNCEPLLVDPGVYSYNDPKWRYYFKSTRNHNTVTIDGKNSSELIGSFRIGKLAKCKAGNWKSNKDFDEVEGSHNGYKNIIHTRKISFIKPYDIIIIDTIYGKGVHEIELNFTLSEFIEDIKLIKGNKCICIFSNTILEFQFSSKIETDNLKIKDAYISKKWYELIDTKKITYTVNGKLPLTITTKILLSQSKK